jgi:hypothetical protein
MKDYIKIKEYLSLKADLLEQTANTLETVANALPNHKEITRRLCDDETTYILDSYGRNFCVRVQTIEWDNYRRNDELNRIRHTTESVTLFDGQGSQPKTTVADLKSNLRVIASVRRAEAVLARQDIKDVEEKDAAYTAAEAHFEAVRDSLSHNLKSVLNAKHLRS